MSSPYWMDGRVLLIGKSLMSETRGFQSAVAWLHSRHATTFYNFIINKNLNLAKNHKTVDRGGTKAKRHVFRMAKN